MPDTDIVICPTRPPVDWNGWAFDTGMLWRHEKTLVWHVLGESTGVQGCWLVSFELCLQFTALSGAVENDPTIFYFEYQVTDERDGRWLTAGGSSTVCFCGVLSFPRLPFGTCRPRGCSNIFRGKYCSNRERERERERDALYLEALVVYMEALEVCRCFFWRWWWGFFEQSWLFWRCFNIVRELLA